MNPNKAIEFFDGQFQRQIRESESVLNPFETLALGYLRGSILDLGCGLGNLSLEAGRRGHKVVAMDASPTAVDHINREARTGSLNVCATQTEIGPHCLGDDYDTIVAIGLLMFFPQETAFELLSAIQDRVLPGGRVIINVLVEGTTFMDLFDDDHYVLMSVQELEARFADWKILVSRRDSFSAPSGKVKEFVTLIADRPIGSGS